MYNVLGSTGIAGGLLFRSLRSLNHLKALMSSPGESSQLSPGIDFEFPQETDNSEDVPISGAEGVSSTPCPFFIGELAGDCQFLRVRA